MVGLVSNSQKHRTLAHRLGTTSHLSAVLMKAKRFGCQTFEDLERLAIKRGLRYYDSSGNSRGHHTGDVLCSKANSSNCLTNEELAIALLSPAAPYSMQRLRMGAALLAADGNCPKTISQLAKWDRSGAVVRYIALCGQRVEPDNSFWSELLELLPQFPPFHDDALPHFSRFVAMTGLTRNGQGPVAQWIRPHTALRS